MENLKIAQRMAHIPPSGIRKVFDEAARLRKEGNSIINFRIGRPDYDTPTHIKAAAKQALDDGFVHYTSNYGLIELRQVIAQKLKRENNLEVDPETELIVTVGANEAIMLAMLALIDPGDEVLIPNPAWAHYYYCVRLAGGIPVSVPLRAENGFQLDPDDVKQNITPRTKLLALNTPHNPTGLVIPLATLETLLAQFALVVVDEAFMDFLPPHEQQSLVDQIERWPHLVILRSLTKFYSLPGLRLGYAIAHPIRLRRWQQWRDPWPVNALAAAAAAVLQDHPFQQQTWQWLAPARPALLQALQAIPGLSPFPGQANYLLVRCDRSVPALQRELLQRDRILIRDCLSFPELGDRYFRIAVRRPEENDRLVAALQRAMHEK